MVDKKLTNNLRVELYKYLFPRVIEEDQNNGVETYINFWDDPLLKWDEGVLWNEVGIVPVIKNLFFAIEQEETKDLEFIDGISDLINPNKCPKRFLGYMARSLGHPLEDGLEEVEQREVIKSIITLNKSRGKELSWEVFYRMIGWKVKAIPLWKKNIFEENDGYSRVKHESSYIENELLGGAGSSYYSGTVGYAPIQPGSIRVAVNGMVFRDNDDKMSSSYGTLVAQDNSTGEFKYATGEYTINLEVVSSTPITMSYKQITETFPYKAARVDLEFFLLLDESATSQ